MLNEEHKRKEMKRKKKKEEQKILQFQVDEQSLAQAQGMEKKEPDALTIDNIEPNPDRLNDVQDLENIEAETIQKEQEEHVSTDIQNIQDSE